MEEIAALFAIAATLCWGADQVLGKASVIDVHPFFFNVVRSCLAAALISTGYLLVGGQFGSIRILAIAIFSGLVGEFLAAELYFTVMKRNPAHLTIPIGNTDPLWGALGATLLLGEKIGIGVLASLFLVVVGTFLLAEYSGEKKGWRGGIALALLVAILWGMMLPLAKICLDGGMSPIAYQMVRIGSAAIGCTIFWMMVGKPLGDISGKSLSLAILSGFLAFFLGFILWLKALDIEAAGTLAPLLGGKVAFGFLLSIGLLGEKVRIKSILGTCLILAGIATATL